MAKCEDCGKPLNEEYAGEWRICKKCRGVQDECEGEVQDVDLSGVANEAATGEIVQLENFKQANSFWIIGVRAFAWFVLILIVVGSVILAIQANGNGALIFIGYTIMAFLFVALLMVFLDMAQNISDIKQILLTKNKKE